MSHEPQIQARAAQPYVAIRRTVSTRGSAWRSRAEHYLTDPSREPDPAKWEVDVAYLTRGA